MRRLPTLLTALVLSAIVSTATLARNAELHTFHCLDGCPVGAPETNDVIVREIYTLSSNDLTKVADWVAYRITPETLRDGDTARDWQADPWLDEDETLEPDDFDGAFAALQTHRGHQAPLASFQGTPFWADTNYLSNITAQKGAMNSGPWMRLEAAERDLVESEGNAVYVLTGPLFERLVEAMPRADERHRVPSGYWKVIATADGRVAAFIMDQDLSQRADYCDMRVGLDHVELRARLMLFPRNEAREFTNLARELGCR